MAFLKCLRIFSALFFVIDLGCKLSYFKSSKFINIGVSSLFWIFLVVRPVSIAAYHIYRLISSLHDFIYVMRKGELNNDQNDPEIKNKKACGIIDIIL